MWCTAMSADDNAQAKYLVRSGKPPGLKTCAASRRRLRGAAQAAKAATAPPSECPAVVTRRQSCTHTCRWSSSPDARARPETAASPAPVARQAPRCRSSGSWTKVPRSARMRCRQPAEYQKPRCSSPPTYAYHCASAPSPPSPLASTGAVKPIRSSGGAYTANANTACSFASSEPLAAKALGSPGRGGPAPLNPACNAASPTNGPAAAAAPAASARAAAIRRPGLKT
mmetsp:Transcript_12182/g.38465  ORF Transcript_12182/g.38465 Transcript_12182/m.38465 type:complete len:227 (+) Transcript_12182:296-976(+)